MGKLFAGLLAATSGTANDVERLAFRSAALSSNRLRVELIERHVPGKVDMDLAKLDRRAYIDKFNGLICRL